MDELLASIAAKQAELERLRAHAPGGLGNFERSQDFELTYTSNAIEGNTLTAVETTQVIEHGLTVGGKPLNDHLEAIDHFAALQYVRRLARHNAPLTELDLRNLHRLIVLRSNPAIAGRYADQARFVLTDAGRIAFPSPAEIPALMGDFAGFLAAAPPAPSTAFAAHHRLVKIHPFNDGNGRTARLLMNLLLLRASYPPVAIRLEDRAAYLASLQSSDPAEFDRLLYARLDATLDEYVQAARQALPPVVEARRDLS